MQALYHSPSLNDEIYAYFKKWKDNSSYKAISKEDRAKIEETIESLAILDKNTENINYSDICEQYVTLASNLVALKWSKKDPKVRVDINLKCDSWFYKLSIAFNKLVDLLNVTLVSLNNSSPSSEDLLALNDELQKVSIIHKIFYEYSIALNNGGELEV